MKVANNKPTSYHLDNIASDFKIAILSLTLLCQLPI